MPSLSELIAPQLFIIQRSCAGMESKLENRRPQLCEEVIRELEQFPAEVLQAVLLILQSRQTASENGT